jgi:hypothetical protein
MSGDSSGHPGLATASANDTITSVKQLLLDILESPDVGGLVAQDSEGEAFEASAVSLAHELEVLALQRLGEVFLAAGLFAAGTRPQTSVTSPNNFA